MLTGYAVHCGTLHPDIWARLSNLRTLYSVAYRPLIDLILRSGLGLDGRAIQMAEPKKNSAVLDPETGEVLYIDEGDEGTLDRVIEALEREEE